ncbi:CAP domain-containing protein [Roseibium sp. CAU 1637]|uniref:CAP domain-containing protein n=2 Tax=Stappiaceae TaxID=2821832 RepID=A0A939EPA7_9HYPH|nr:CAP domain-containing protein [Roseibium limicola]
MEQTLKAPPAAAGRSVLCMRAPVMALLASLLLLAGCGALPGRGELEDAPTFRSVPVDGNQVLEELNGYRARHNLPALSYDPVLTQVSAEMTRRIAERDSMDTWAHSSFGLGQRLEAARYENYAAAENLGAGYADLSAAFAGWQGSAGHNKNLLNPYVTRVGVASMDRSNGKWRHFWVMTLARPRSDGRPTLAPGYD